MPCLQLIINAIPIAAGIFVKYSFFRKLGFGKDYLEGLKEGIRTAKKCKKVAYRPERLKNYLAIELELLAGTFLYVYEFAVRQIEKKQHLINREEKVRVVTGRVCVDSNLEFARCVNGHGLADATRRKAAYQTMSERQQASER